MDRFREKAKERPLENVREEANERHKVQDANGIPESWRVKAAQKPVLTAAAIAVLGSLIWKVTAKSKN